MIYITQQYHLNINNCYDKTVRTSLSSVVNNQDIRVTFLCV